MQHEAAPEQAAMVEHHREHQMLARKPPMVVIVALANENARIAWALPARGGVYRAPAVA
jgi:hypothetical protein